MVEKLTRREFLKGAARATVMASLGGAMWRLLVPVKPVVGREIVEPKSTQKFKKLLPEAAQFKAVVKDEETVYYEAYDAEGLLIGYAFIADRYAFTDRLEIVGIVDLDYKVDAIDVERYPEFYGNPGIIEPEFEEQFIGLSVEEIYLSPDGEIDAVSGATISSTAVTNAVREKIEEIVQE